MPHNELFARVLSWLLTYAVHSSVLLGAVWLALRCFPPRGLALRERLWKLALLGPLVTASLQVALGARPWLGRFEWSAAAPERVAVLAPEARMPPEVPLVEAAEVEAEGSPAEQTLRAELPRRARRPARGGPALPGVRDSELAPELVATADMPVDEPAPVVFPHDERTSPRTEPAPPATTARTSATGPDEAPASPLATLQAPPSWPGLVLVAWAALGLLGVLGVTASFVALYRRLSGREILRTGPLVETLESLRARAGLRRRVRLSISSRVPAPFSTGLLLPEICLPRAAVAGLTPAQQEVMLAHELGHLLRRDPFWFTASYLVERLFFFQPLNRVARRELSELAELACDDWAVRWTGSRLALASCLAEVAGWLVAEPRRPLALPGLTAPRSPLARRVARLLDDRRSPTCEPRVRSFPLAALGALGLTVAAVPGISAASPVREGALVEPEAPALTLAPAPTSAPASASAPSTAPAALAELPLARMRRELAEQLLALEQELVALRAELAQRALDDRFAAELSAIESRLEALRAQEARAAALLEALATPHTPAPARR